MTQQMVLVRSTMYSAKTRLIVRDGGIGVACQPMWTVVVPREKDARHPRASSMSRWLRENVEHETYQLYMISAMSFEIEAVTFDHHEDALMFYMAFKS